MRALCAALDEPWDKVYTTLTLQGYVMGDMPSSNAVWGAVLKNRGFVRAVPPNTCPDCYSAEDFAMEHPHGTHVLAFPGHVATVIDGTLYDSWDSSKETVLYYYTYTKG